MFLDIFEMARTAGSFQPTPSPHSLTPGPPIDPLEIQTNRTPLAALLKNFQCLCSENNQWPASWPAFSYLILPSFAGSYQQEEGGDSCGNFPGPPQWGRWGDWLGGHSEWGDEQQPSLSELWGGPLWLVMGPQRLWWVNPSHWGATTAPHHFSNIFPSISPFLFKISSNHCSNVYLKLIFLSPFITNGNFLLLQDLRKLREVAEWKCYAAHLEW